MGILLLFFLPNHAVIREDKQTTKTRVVFDASARDSNGVSLNSCLEAGPALQPDLVGILLRFRKNQVGIMGDIKKMFLQIRLKEEDRDSHRYLWRDLDPDAITRIYRMTRVTFGVISSPFLAICTIQENARRCKETFPEASNEILRNTYVDDFASGKDGVHEALKLQLSSTELMEQAARELVNNSVFGKTMENLRNMNMKQHQHQHEQHAQHQHETCATSTCNINMKLVRADENEKICKLIASPLYASNTVFSNNLAAIQMHSEKIKLVKPDQAGEAYAYCTSARR